MTVSLREQMTVCPDCICAPILCRADTSGQDMAVPAGAK